MPIRMARVLFTQAQMKQYRLPFFTKLHAALLQDGIGMKVVYSDPPKADKRKGDNVDLPPDIGIKVPGYHLLGNRLFYQALIRQAMAADLVVAEQANKNLHLYILLLMRVLRVKPLAFWGLGASKDLDRSEFSERVRPWIARRADWWFTYTNGTVGWLASVGVAREKVTVMQNSTDTRGFARQIEDIPDEQVSQIHRRLGIAAGDRVGLFCGILAPDKGINFLLEAARLVRNRVPNFHLLILGGGAESEQVVRAAAQSPWIHYLGPKFGEEKALFLKASDCFLLPGRVGLAILDAFAAGLPLITTNVPFHGPEVEYLENGVNGKMTASRAEAYAKSVAEVLSNTALLDRLKAGACQSARQYSIESMVERCRLGILECLTASGIAVKLADSTPAYFGTDRG